MRNIAKTMMCILMVCISVAGCSRRDMLYEYDFGQEPGQDQPTPSGPYTNLELNVDWSELGHSPNGVTAIFYPKDGGKPLTYLSHNVHTTDIAVPEGLYDLVVHNNSPEEFASIGFNGMDVYKTSEFLYTQKGANPEQLCVANLQNVIIAGVTQVLDVEPKNLFVDGVIRIEAKGVHNIRFMKAHFTGLAGSYMVSTDVAKAGELGFKTETDQWKLKKQNGEYGTGTLTSTFRTLGLPEQGWRGDIKASPGEVKLHIQMLLVDNKTNQEYTFPVGDMIKVWSQDGKPCIYITFDSIPESDYYPIVIPDVKPADGSSNGFGADVEDWGDDEDYELGV